MHLLFWSELEVSSQLNVDGRTANQNGKVSRFGVGGAFHYIEERECSTVQQECYLSRFSWLQIHLCKSFQFLGRPRHARMRIAHVQLRYFGSLPRTSILDLKGNLYQSLCPSRFRGDFQIAVFKMGIRETLPKRKARIYRGAI